MFLDYLESKNPNLNGEVIDFAMETCWLESYGDGAHVDYRGANVIGFKSNKGINFGDVYEVKILSRENVFELFKYDEVVK